MVYTRVGDYQGHEEHESGWELIFNEKVEMEKGVPSSLGALDRDVTIPAESTQAFYIWCTEGVLYTEGNTEGAPFDSDDSLVINEGIVTTGLFHQVTGNGQYSGGVRYVLVYNRV